MMIFRIPLVILLTLCIFGCVSVAEDAAARSRINHVVLCWLKEPGNIAHRNKIIASSRSFAYIPGVLEVRAGTAIQSERDIVDDSFDVAVYFTFKTPEDMKKYITHPSHKQAVDNVLLPLVDRMVVYDFIEPRE